MATVQNPHVKIVDQTITINRLFVHEISFVILISLVTKKKALHRLLLQNIMPPQHDH